MPNRRLAEWGDDNTVKPLETNQGKPKKDGAVRWQASVSPSLRPSLYRPHVALRFPSAAAAAAGLTPPRQRYAQTSSAHALVAVSVRRGLEMHFGERARLHLLCGFLTKPRLPPRTSAINISQEVRKCSIS